MNSKNILKNLKSSHILKRIIGNLTEYKLLKFIKYNKNIQKKIGFGYKNYKKYLRTEIELFPVKNKHNSFITIKKEETNYFHIFFNDNENEIGRNHISEENNVSKIKIIID